MSCAVFTRVEWAIYRSGRTMTRADGGSCTSAGRQVFKCVSSPINFVMESYVLAGWWYSTQKFSDSSFSAMTILCLSPLHNSEILISISLAKLYSGTCHMDSTMTGLMVFPKLVWSLPQNNNVSGEALYAAGRVLTQRAVCLPVLLTIWWSVLRSSKCAGSSLAMDRLRSKAVSGRNLPASIRDGSGTALTNGEEASSAKCNYKSCQISDSCVIVRI